MKPTFFLIHIVLHTKIGLKIMVKKEKKVTCIKKFITWMASDIREFTIILYIYVVRL